MTIQIDTREHKLEVERIEKQLDALGIQHFRSKLYCGDYQSLDNGRLVIDRKKNLQELCGNVTQQHERFRRELVRAQQAGIRIIVLCEHGHGIKTMEDVEGWVNPRLSQAKWVVENGRPMNPPAYPKATTGKSLAAALRTISTRYGVDFVFCDPRSTGKIIASILGGEHEK